MSQLNHHDKLVISYPCWGELYISTACQFSLPSFFAQGNIPALVNQGLAITFQFFTDDEGVNYFKRHEFYSTVIKYCDIEFVDINEMQSNKNLTNNEKLIDCHNHSFIEAAKTQAILFPACSDLIISNESLLYFYSLLSDGYRVVLNSPLRVSLNAVEERVSETLSVNNDGLTANYLSDLAIKNLHHSERALLNDSEYFAAGWPGNQMWMKENHSLIKRGIYLCPFFIRTQIGESFGFASLDNSLYLNKFLKSWDRDVYIVQDTSHSVCVDFTDDDYHVVGIDHINDINDDEPPFEREKFVAAAMLVNPCQPWHYKTLEYPIVYTLTGVLVDQRLLEQSNDFIKNVDNWLVYFKEHSLLYKFTDNAINYQRDKRSTNFCHYAFDSNEIYVAVESYLKKLKLKGESVVLYGMGEWLKYINFNIDLSLYDVVLTDSNYALVESGFSDILCIPSTEIERYADNVLVVSIAFKNEITHFLESSYRNLTISHLNHLRNSFEK